MGHAIAGRSVPMTSTYASCILLLKSLNFIYNNVYIMQGNGYCNDSQQTDPRSDIMNFCNNSKYKKILYDCKSFVIVFLKEHRLYFNVMLNVSRERFLPRQKLTKWSVG